MGIVFTLLSFAFFIWFLLPVFSGVINLGNGAGLALFGLLSVYGVFSLKLQPVLRRFLATFTGHILKYVIAAGCLAALAVCLILSCQMIRHATKAPTGDTTMVVLGCRVKGSRPSLMLTERLDAACDYLNSHPEQVCILSGGKGTGEDISEADCMYTYLVERGIDESRLYKEDQSTSTRENLKFSYEIIKENRFPEDLLIVTNEFHQYRASLIAGSLGLNCFAQSGPTAWWLLATYWVREWFALVQQIVLL